ncbi:MAG TPA: hypothetical protein VIH57_26445 [Bacteroidales bacterium]
MIYFLNKYRNDYTSRDLSVGDGQFSSGNGYSQELILSISKKTRRMRLYLILEIMLSIITVLLTIIFIYLTNY